MNKSKELKTTTEIVHEVLKTYEQARNSDMILYVKVCERVNPKALDEPFWFVMLNLKDYNLPNIETVRRVRQKLQASHPELAGDVNVEAQRMLNEEVFKKYAMGMV